MKEITYFLFFQTIQPSTDDIQQTLNKGYQNILEVCRSVKEWSQLKIDQTSATGKIWKLAVKER